MKNRWETKSFKAMLIALGLASLCACGTGGSGSGANGVGSGTTGCATNPACAPQSIDSIAYGAGIYVAGGMGGLPSGGGDTIGPWMETSADGVNWKVVDTGDSSRSGDFNSIVYGAKGFVAVDYPGTHLYFSADAKTWEEVTPKGVSKNQLSSVDWDGSEYIAYADPYLFTSQDGKAWNKVPATFIHNLPASIRKLSGTYYALSGLNATPFMSSTDLATWTPYSASITGFDPTTNSLTEMIDAAGQLLVIGGKGVTATSPDGTTWTGHPTGDSSDNFQEVAYNGTVYVQVGNCGNVDTSPDAATWTKVDISGLVKAPETDCVSGITAASGGAFVAITGTHGLTSMDGIHWTAFKF